MANWSDRSRFLGFPLKPTSYELIGNKLYIKRGYISNHEEQVLLHRVIDMSLREGIVDKFCNQGTIILTTTDNNNEVVYLENIANAKAVRDLISDRVEEERIKHGVISREHMGYAHRDDIGY